MDLIKFTRQISGEIKVSGLFKMKKLLKQSLGVVKDAAALVGFNVVEKTEDSDYENAKQAFKTILSDTVQIIGCVMQMNAQIQVLSRSVTKLGASLVVSMNSATPNAKGEATAIDLLAKKLDEFTIKGLVRQIDTNVIAPLSVYQKEIERLKEVQAQRRPARKEYDQARSKLKHLQKSNATVGEIDQLQQKTDELKRKYEYLNSNFISGVNMLIAGKSKYLETPFREFVNAFQRYTSSIQNEFQKASQSFPAQCSIISTTPTANPYSQIPMYAPPPEAVVYPEVIMPQEPVIQPDPKPEPKKKEKVALAV